MSLFRWLACQRRRVVMGLAGFLTLLVAYLDLITGPEYAFTVFYVAPVVLAAWYVSSRMGSVMCVLATALWFGADALCSSVHSHPLVPVWNGLVLLGFLLIVSWVTTALRAASQMQEELAQFIVHDLRSPLVVIQMSLNTLRKLAGSDMAERQRTLVDLALDSSDRMLTLISSLLDLSKLEHGSLQAELEPVPPAEVVADAVRQIVPWADANQVRLDVTGSDGAPCAMADTNLTQRVLVNLLSNAIKHSPRDATVGVDVCPWEGSQVRFSVSDSGPGIPPEWLGRIFDKFAQVKARQAGAAVGTGLGLTFCRLAVEAQKGRIWAESERDQRTVFHFTLPASEACPTKEPPDEA
jgi:signal transduction histidine kinase